MKKTEDPSDNVSDSLPELLINDVDSEQIYQQLQLHNVSGFGSLVKYFSKCLVRPHEITFNVNMDASKASKQKKRLEKRRQELEYEDSTDEEEENDIDDDAAILEDYSKDNKKSKNVKNDTVFGIPDGSDSEISDFDVEENEDEDDEEGEEDENEDNEEEDDDDDIDLFKGEDDEDMKTTNKKKKTKKSAENINDLDSDEIDEDLVDMYGDLGDEKEVLEIGKTAEYKDDLDELEEQDVDIKEKPKKTVEKKKVAFKDLFENDDDEKDSGSEVDENGMKKSSFEKRQEKVYCYLVFH